MLVRSYNAHALTVLPWEPGYVPTTEQPSGGVTILIIIRHDRRRGWLPFVPLGEADFTFSHVISGNQAKWKQIENFCQMTTLTRPIRLTPGFYSNQLRVSVIQNRVNVWVSREHGRGDGVSAVNLGIRKLEPDGRGDVLSVCRIDSEKWHTKSNACTHIQRVITCTRTTFTHASTTDTHAN